MRKILHIGMCVCLFVFCSAQASTSIPVVFAHGLLVPPEVYDYVLPHKKMFKEKGMDFLVAYTPLSGSIQSRAYELSREIRRLVPHGYFHLLGHSMGGLDVRYLVYKDKALAARCLSVTTISSPHRGTPVADFVMDNISQNYSLVKKLLSFFKLDVQAVHDLTKGYAINFNSRVPNDPRIRYYSFAYYIPDPVILKSFVPWLWLSHKIIANAGEPQNDGLVGVESAKWGQFLGAIEGDHLFSGTAVEPMIDQYVLELNRFMILW